MSADSFLRLLSRAFAKFTPRDIVANEVAMIFFVQYAIKPIMTLSCYCYVVLSNRLLAVARTYCTLWQMIIFFYPADGGQFYDVSRSSRSDFVADVVADEEFAKVVPMKWIVHDPVLWIGAAAVS